MEKAQGHLSDVTQKIKQYCIAITLDYISWALQ